MTTLGPPRKSARGLGPRRDDPGKVAQETGAQETGAQYVGTQDAGASEAGSESSRPAPEEAMRLGDEKILSLQAKLRKVIISLQKDPSLTQEEKAERIQELLSRPWRNSTQSRPGASEKPAIKRRFGECTKSDKQPSYNDEEKGILGCKHYQRSIKLQSYCCGRWEVCRFCHDETSDHRVVRSQVLNMMCMYCSTIQPLSQYCSNKKCGKMLAKYYCRSCLLWDSDVNKNIYHCDMCGICRMGKGLGIDYFHCVKCGVCLAMCLKGKHKCIERNLECNCPVCGEYMFTSTTIVMFMKCSHCIHVKCYKEHIKRHYQCPICLKSLTDMKEHFKMIDKMLSEESMPPEYQDWYNYIYCNDCEKKCYSKYHFMYHKCTFCLGYNTRILRLYKSLAQIPSEELTKI